MPMPNMSTMVESSPSPSPSSSSVPTSKRSTRSKTLSNRTVHVILDSNTNSESEASAFRASAVSTPDLIMLDSPIRAVRSKSRLIFDCVLIPRKHVTVTIDPSRTLSQPLSEVSSSETDPSADEDYSVGSDSGGERRGTRRRRGGGRDDDGVRPLGTKEHGDLVRILERTVTRQGRIYYTVVWSDGVQTQESPEELHPYQAQVETYECQLMAKGGPSIANSSLSRRRIPGPRYREINSSSDSSAKPLRHRKPGRPLRGQKVNYSERGAFENAADTNWRGKPERKRGAYESDDDLGGFAVRSTASEDEDENDGNKAGSDSAGRRRSTRIRKTRKLKPPPPPMVVPPPPRVTRRRTSRSSSPPPSTQTDMLLTPTFIAQHWKWCARCGHPGPVTGKQVREMRAGRKRRRRGTDDEWEFDEEEQGKLLLCRCCSAAYHEGCLPKGRNEIGRLFVKGPGGEREFRCTGCIKKCECEECGKKWKDERVKKGKQDQSDEIKDHVMVVDKDDKKDYVKKNGEASVAFKKKETITLDEDVMELDKSTVVQLTHTKSDVNMKDHVSRGTRSVGAASTSNPISANESPLSPISDFASSNENKGEDIREVLFRCRRCDLLCHWACMPPLPDEDDLLQLDDDDDDTTRLEARKTYVCKDWMCHECVKWPVDVDAILTYREAKKVEANSAAGKLTSHVSPKPASTNSAYEYLVKFKNQSYRKVEWVTDRWLASSQRQRYQSYWRNDPVPSAVEDVVMKEWCCVDRLLDVVAKRTARGRPKGKGKKWVKKEVKKSKRGKAKRVVEDEEDDDDDEEEEERSENEEKYDSDSDGIEDVERIYAVWRDLPYDQATWDDPPNPDSDSYPFYRNAYRMWKKGKKIHVPSGMERQVTKAIAEARAGGYHEMTKQPTYIKGGTLMKYQLEGLNWLVYQWEKQQACILADDMGLGKTIQIISFCSHLFHERGIFPFVIVVPNSTVTNWVREFNKWAPAISVVPYMGSAESRRLARDHEIFHEHSSDLKCHVVVTTYETMITDVGVFKKVPFWPTLIVDEGQRLKNDESLLFKKLKELNVGQKILLTGTPLQNNIRELFNLMNFLDPKKWKDLEDLEEKYENMTFDLMLELHELLKPYFLRRTKAGVLKHLPPKAEIIVPVSMSPYQKEIYKDILSRNWEQLRSLVPERKVSGSSGRGDGHKLNNILMQLRKCLNHPYTIEGLEPRYKDENQTHLRLIEASGKLVLLHQMLPKLKERGHRVLIFSTMRLALDVLEDYIIKEGYKYVRLDGETPTIQRQRNIDAFNAPDSEIFIFLLTTRAGGVGVNLATADTIIIYDADFNPHADLQALSRAHRIGQLKKVLVFKLMTRGSAEERIIQLGKKKMILDHLIVAKMDDGDLDKDDIESVLKFGAKALFEGDESKDIKYDSAAIDKLLDRSQMEAVKDTEEDEDESSKAMSFSFARIWSTEGGGALEEVKDNSAELEEQDDSFWAKVLKERALQVEVQKLEEKEQEITGRGARKRAKAVSYVEQDQVAGLQDVQPKKRGRPPKKNKIQEVDADSNDADFILKEDEKDPISSDTASDQDTDGLDMMNSSTGKSIMEKKAAKEKKTKEKSAKKNLTKQQPKQSPQMININFGQAASSPISPGTGAPGTYRSIEPHPKAERITVKIQRPAPIPPQKPHYQSAVAAYSPVMTTCILCMTAHGNECPNMFNVALIQKRLQGLGTMAGISNIDRPMIEQKLGILLMQAAEVNRNININRSSAAAAAASAFNGAPLRQPPDEFSECPICERQHNGKCPSANNLDFLIRRKEAVKMEPMSNQMKKMLLKELDKYIIEASQLHLAPQTAHQVNALTSETPARQPEELSETLKFMFGQTLIPTNAESSQIPLHGQASPSYGVKSVCYICNASPAHLFFQCPMKDQSELLIQRYRELMGDNTIPDGKKAEILSTLHMYMNNRVAKDKRGSGVMRRMSSINELAQYSGQNSLIQGATPRVQHLGVSNSEELALLYGNSSDNYKNGNASNSTPNASHDVADKGKLEVIDLTEL